MIHGQACAGTVQFACYVYMRKVQAMRSAGGKFAKVPIAIPAMIQLPATSYQLPATSYQLVRVKYRPEDSHENVTCCRCGADCASHLRTARAAQRRGRHVWTCAPDRGGSQGAPSDVGR